MTSVFPPPSPKAGASGAGDLWGCALYADREFYATDVFSTLEQRDIFYVIPAPRDDRVKRFIARMTEDGDGTKQVTVKHDHAVYGPVKHGVTKSRAETTLVGLPPDEDRETVQVFATNLDVNGLLDPAVSLRIRGAVVRSVVAGGLSGPDLDRCRGVSHETAGDGTAVSCIPPPRGERIAVDLGPWKPFVRGITVGFG